MSNSPEHIPSCIKLDDSFIRLCQEWCVHPLPETTPRNCGILSSSPSPLQFSTSLVSRNTAADFHNTGNFSSVLGFYRTFVEKAKTEKQSIKEESSFIHPDHILPVSEAIKNQGPDTVQLIIHGKLFITCRGKKLGRIRSGYSVSPCPPSTYLQDRIETYPLLDPIPPPPSYDLLDTPNYPGLPTFKSSRKVESSIYDSWIAPCAPIRSVTSILHDPNFISLPPKTPFANLIESKLVDPTASGALLNLIKAYPNVDVASVNAVSKALISDTDSWREERALLCCSLLAAVTAPDAPKCDSAPLKFIRRARNAIREPVPTFYNPSPEPKNLEGKTYSAWNFQITTIDVLGQYLTNKFPSSTGGFSKAQMDASWTVIPLKISDLDSRGLVPYIQSFLDNELWWGKLTYATPVTVKNKQGEDVPLVYTTMPKAGMVRIPGPKSFMLVIVDTTGQYVPDRITIFGTQFLVAKWPTTITSTTYTYDWYYKVWKKFWIADNYLDMAGHIGYAYNRLLGTYSIMDTAGRALSLAGELSQSLTYGVNVTNNASSDSACPGCWTIGGGYVEDNKVVMSKDIMATDFESDTIGEALTGKMFSEISPWHLLHTGYLKTTSSTDHKNITIAGVSTKVVSGQKISLNLENVDLHETPQYTAFTASSIFRIAIQLGWCPLAKHGYTVNSANALQLFILGIGHAHSLNFSSFLISSNIPISTWQGRDSDCNSSANQLVDTWIQNLTVRQAKFVPMQTLEESALEWTWNHVSAYYFDIPWDSSSWSNNSPISTFFVLMWLQKHGKLTAPCFKPLTWAFNKDTREMGVNLLTLDFIHYLHITATPDIYVNQPIVWAFSSQPIKTSLWYEDYPGTSLIVPDRNAIFNVHRFGSTALSYPKTTWPAGDVSDAYIVTNSSQFSVPSDQKGIVIPAILFPDPPTVGGFLEKIRDYIVFPALSGGLGYLAGGPPGAVVGAATSVMDAIKTDVAKSALKSATKDLSKVVPQIPLSTIPPTPITEVPKTQDSETLPPTDGLGHQSS